MEGSHRLVAVARGAERSADTFIMVEMPGAGSLGQPLVAVHQDCEIELAKRATHRVRGLIVELLALALVVEL